MVEPLSRPLTMGGYTTHPFTHPRFQVPGRRAVLQRPLLEVIVYVSSGKLSYIGKEFFKGKYFLVVGSIGESSHN